MQHQPRGSWQLRAKQARPSTSPTLRAVSAAALFRRRTSSARRALSSRSRRSASCCAFLRTGWPGSEQRQRAGAARGSMRCQYKKQPGHPCLLTVPRWSRHVQDQSCLCLQERGRRHFRSASPFCQCSASSDMLTCVWFWTFGCRQFCCTWTVLPPLTCAEQPPPHACRWRPPGLPGSAPPWHGPAPAAKKIACCQGPGYVSTTGQSSCPECSREQTAESAG